RPARSSSRYFIRSAAYPSRSRPTDSPEEAKNTARPEGGLPRKNDHAKTQRRKDVIPLRLCVCAGHGIRPKEVDREVANKPTKAGNRKAKADREATRRCKSSGGPGGGNP